MSFASLRRVLRTARKGLCSTCSRTKYPQLEAAGAGHVGCLIYTLETMGNNVRDNYDVTAMHVAARKGQIAILIYLVENGIVTHVPRARNGASPAHDAAGTGNLDCLRYLLKRTKASPNDLDNNLATPLHWAAQTGQLQVVQWLVVDALARIDVKARNGVTPLHLAAARNQLDVLRWLAAFAFRHYQRPMHLINAKDMNGTTPFYHAAVAGHIDIIRWLAEKGGGDPTIYSSEGYAPLHIATANGHLECVKYLFQFGLATAPGGLRTNEGSSALHLAASEGRIEILNWLLDQKECTGMERDYYQCTPMHDAAEAGNLKVLKILCEKQIDCTVTDVEHNTPVDMAQRSNHYKCANYLKGQQKKVLQKRNLINNSAVPHSRHHKLHRQRPTQAEMLDRFRHAPPHRHVVMASAYDDDNDIDGFDRIGRVGLRNEPVGRPLRNAIPHHDELSEGTEWVTLHDLMDEEEIEEMSLEDTEKAEQKRRAFEEKLEKEAKEKERKKLQADQKLQEAEKEIRYRMEEEEEGEIELMKKLQSLESALAEGHRELAAALESSTGKKTGLMKKSESEPKGLNRKEKAYSIPATKEEMGNKIITEDLESEGKKNQKWLTKLLKRGGNSAPQISGMSQSKSFDSLSSETQSASKNDSELGKLIPTPPPLPSARFLLGKKPMMKKPGLSLKEELLEKSWGRDAYDNDDASNSDEGESKQRPSHHKISRSKVHPKQLSKKKRSSKVEDRKLPAMLGGYGSSPRQKRKLLGEQRQLTPYPANAPLFTLKSDMPVPKKLDFDSDSPSSPPVSPSATTPSATSQATPTTPHVQTTSAQPYTITPLKQATSDNSVLKPVRPAPPPPQPSTAPPPKPSTAPIAKVASARTKRPMAAKPVQQPVNNRPNTQDSSPPSPAPPPPTPLPPTPPPPSPPSYRTIARPLSSADALDRQRDRLEAQLLRQLGSQNHAIKKQTSGTNEEKEDDEDMSDSSDESLTDSSEEEDDDDDEEEETSDTEESSDDEDGSMVEATRVEAPRHVTIPMRPIMAKNKAMLGARAAKNAMMRMKSARYPRILRRQVIKLETIDEVRYEKIHETETEEEKAEVFHRVQLQRRTLIHWKGYILLLKTARRRAERLGQRKRRELLAKVFYGWVQARNEGGGTEEVAIADQKKKQARDSQSTLKKAEQDRTNNLRRAVQDHRKDMQKRGPDQVQELTRKQQNTKKEPVKKEPTTKEAVPVVPRSQPMSKQQQEERYLQWLNSQLMLIGKPQVDNLSESLADASLLILALANASGLKTPRFKNAPKLKLHKQDNWRVAFEFTKQIGIVVRGIEPSDLADLHEAAIFNLFNGIMRWQSKQQSK